MSNQSESFCEGIEAMSAKQIESKGADNRPIGQGISITHGRFIFFHDNIFDPMQAVFNLPMLSDLMS